MMIRYCANNTGQQIFLGRVVKVHLDTGQSILLVNSGQPQLLSNHKHQGRNVERRNVSAESRAKRIKVDAEKCDLIGCWDDLRIYCANINLATDLGNDIIKLHHIEGMSPSIIYSIFISRDMRMSAYKGNSSINLRDVIP